MGLGEMIVNGSCAKDWPKVAALAGRLPWVRPAFGLHPWHVKEREPTWMEMLREHLLAHPQAVVGETGLDRWIDHHNIEAQIECFKTQISLAVEFDRPITIHCLRAFGLLDDVLRSVTLPRRGFLLHSYGGPIEMVPSFVKLGAYFSISPYFGHPRKATLLATFARIPLNRLLAETDAPDMHPPQDLNLHPLTNTDGKTLNHPANLLVSYDLIARQHEITRQTAEQIVAANYARLFGA